MSTVLHWRLLVLLSLVVSGLGMFVCLAEAQSLPSAEAALSRGAYAQSRQLASQAIHSGTRVGTELVEPYRVLALSCGYLDDADAATRAFTLLLALDPSYRLPDGLPAEVRSPYMNARGFWSVHVERLSAQVAFDPDDANALLIALRDPAALTARVRVRARVAGTERFVESVRPPEATLTMPVDRLAVAGEVEYTVALLDEHGNRIWQLGSDASPLRLSRPTTAEVAGPSVAVSAVRGPRAGDILVQPEGRRRRPYVISGSTLLALGAGAAVAGGLAHLRREQLAARWNRGECDGQGTTRGAICASENQGIQDMTRLATVLYGSGAAAALAGLTVLLFAPRRSEFRPDESLNRTAWRCSQGGFALGLACSRGF